MISQLLLLIPSSSLAAVPALQTAQGPIELPEPSGPHAVGYRKCSVIDTERSESLTPEPGDHRELVLEFWYPAAPDAPGEARPTRPYMDEAVAREWSSDHVLPEGFQHDVSTHAHPDAPALEGEQPAPLLIFSPGLSFPPQNYQASLEDLASHGYVVAAINHTFAVTCVEFPDGRTASWRLFDESSQAVSEASLAEHLETWVADVRFVIDRLLDDADAGSLLPVGVDRERLGVYGHSFGGMAGLYALHEDDRIQAALAMEGRIYEPLDRPLPVMRPFLFLLGGDNRQLTEDFEGGSGCYVEVVIPGATHVAFGDLLYVYEHYADEARAGRRAAGTAPARVIELTNATVRAFFDEQLRGRPGWLSNNAEKPFEGIELRVR